MTTPKRGLLEEINKEEIRKLRSVEKARWQGRFTAELRHVVCLQLIKHSVNAICYFFQTDYISYLN